MHSLLCDESGGGVVAECLIAIHFLCRSIESQYIGSMFETKDHSMVVHCPIYSASGTSARARMADEEQLREKPPRERRKGHGKRAGKVF